ncbi:MAG: TRAP transporter fused permease subunit [Armatimonadetes bacterium]|nr:TRAP transporter fused permease subunit [Armatimonadota bacterium]
MVDVLLSRSTSTEVRFTTEVIWQTNWKGVCYLAAGFGEQEQKTKCRSYQGGMKRVVLVLTALFSLFFICNAIVAIPFHYSLAIYVGGTLTFIFLFYPARAASPRSLPSAFDLGCILLTLIPTIYFVASYEELLLRAGHIKTEEVIFGLMLTIASLEACRRVIGWILPVLAMLFFAYDIIGPYLPGVISHSGFPLERIIGTIYGNTGVYGVVARTYAVYVLIFILFGAFLERSGAGKAFTNLALALLGRSRGGAAKASVVSSGLAGMVLGSGAANISITGTFTIPLMKKTGFPGHVAGAVETVSSIGGHLMPPVMGAVAFLMASFTGIPYTYIALMSAAPAVLLYVAIYASVHFYSKKNPEIRALEKGSVPSVATTLKKDSIYLLPIVALVAALAGGFSPFRAAVLGMIVSVVVAFFRRETRFSLNDFIHTLSKGAVDSLMVGATAGVMGILLAALLLPGAPLLFSSWVVHFAGGNLLIALILVIIACYILGMGMTVTAAYILISIVAVAPLIEMGVPLFTAHLILIWFSQYSSFSPPFCLGAFVAAGIAGSDPMKTGWRSVILGKPYYIIPFLMVYTPLLGLDGITISTIIQWISCGIGLVVTSAIFERYFYRVLKWWEITALSGAAGLLFMPSHNTDAIGILILLMILIPQYLQAAKKVKIAS